MTGKKEAKKKENWIYDNFLFGLRYIKDSRNYILFAFLLFLVFVSLGFAFPSLFEEQILKIIEELIKETEGLGTLELISFIIFNNLKSAFFGLILGVFFAIVPFVITIVNGYVLGFVVNKSISAEGILVLWRLFPHGIFEIPAVLISIGLGLKLGIWVFIVVIGEFIKFYWIKNKLILILFFLLPVPFFLIMLINDKYFRKRLKISVTKKPFSLKISLKVFLLIIIPLLVIAGIIEGFLIGLLG